MKTQGCNIDLITAIRAKGLTQRELADRVNVTEQQVSRWVNDVRITPHKNHRDMLKVIGIDVYKGK